MIWMSWDAVNEGLEPHPRPYNITRARPYINFPKIPPHLHKQNSVRVDPYAHPHFIKVLKLILYM